MDKYIHIRFNIGEKLRGSRSLRRLTTRGHNLRTGLALEWRMRGQRPFVFTNLKTGAGLDAVAAFILKAGGLSPR